MLPCSVRRSIRILSQTTYNWNQSRIKTANVVTSNRPSVPDWFYPLSLCTYKICCCSLSALPRRIYAWFQLRKIGGARKTHMTWLWTPPFWTSDWSEFSGTSLIELASRIAWSATHRPSRLNWKIIYVTKRERETRSNSIIIIILSRELNWI